MDFPLPIRSITSTVEFSTPLFVDTNIVYQIDDTKFPGLKGSSHGWEPALIVDPDMSWNPNNNWSETTEMYTSTTTCDYENQDLYSLIDSLDVEYSMLSPVISGIDTLDLPDIQLELPKYDRPISICDRNPVDIQVVTDCDVQSVCSQLDSTFGKPAIAISSDTNSNPCDNIYTQSFTSGQMPCCRFAKTRMCSKRKRHMSSAFQDEVTNSDAIGQFVCLKKAKLNMHEPFLTSCSKTNFFESVLDDLYSLRTLFPAFEQTSVFNFTGSPIKSLTDRQW